eukprot:124039-Chlamydomonas_euryale.AAC.5
MRGKVARPRVGLDEQPAGAHAQRTRPCLGGWVVAGQSSDVWARRSTPPPALLAVRVLPLPVRGLSPPASCGHAVGPSACALRRRASRLSGKNRHKLNFFGRVVEPPGLVFFRWCVLAVF